MLSHKANPKVHVHVHVHNENSVGWRHPLAIAQVVEL